MSDSSEILPASVLRTINSRIRVRTKIMDRYITHPVKKILETFEDRGKEIRIVGGAVRDILVGRMPSDFDFATNALPDEIKKICKDGHINCYETGLKHGTLTAVINHINYEITTLRRDVETDGRHAVVEFVNDWKLDAERRDLTINAMSLSYHGYVHDYFDGISDLVSKRIRFVNDPRTRITEDYLRILRYFRFFGKISDTPPDEESFDSETMEVIKELGPNLSGISRERIWKELSLIITGPFAPEIMNKICEVNLLEYCGVKSSHPLNFKRFNYYYKSAVKREEHYDVPLIAACTLFSALFEEVQDVEDSCRQLKMSNAMRNLSLFMLANRQDRYTDDEGEDDKGAEHNEGDGEDTKKFCSIDRYKIMLMNNFVVNRIQQFKSIIIQLMLCENIPNSSIVEFIEWDVPIFPLNGNDIQNQVTGVKIKTALAYLKEIWINSGFTITKEQLLQEFTKKFKD